MGRTGLEEAHASADGDACFGTIMLEACTGLFRCDECSSLWESLDSDPFGSGSEHNPAFCDKGKACLGDELLPVEEDPDPFSNPADGYTGTGKPAHKAHKEA